MPETVWTWMTFGVVVSIMLALDLGVFHRKSHVIKVREALIWSGVWIGISLAFNLWLYFDLGAEPALMFLTGYLIEKSLSVDNIFVFIMIFSYFSVHPKYQHKILFWGILGALFMRGFMIAMGVTLINRFHWIIYIFGAFLIYTGIRMMFHDQEDVHPDKNVVLRLLQKQRFFPVISTFRGDKFIIRRQGSWLITPLLVVLLIVETTDILFALDSIPAILSITTDPFIVFSSNIFAILGLRALYFALAGIMQIFHYLHYGVSLILAFVGLKMLLSDVWDMPVSIALGVIALVLLGSILLSIFHPKKKVADVQRM